MPSRMKTDSMSLKHFMLGTEGSLKKRYASGSERVLYEASQAAATEGTAYGCELNGHYSNSLRERFIRRLIVNGKKSIATKIFDESLELLKKRIEEVNFELKSLINLINEEEKKWEDLVVKIEEHY